MKEKEFKERKPLDLKKVVAFLSQLKENPEQYRKIIIRVDFIGKLMFIKDNYNFIDYEGDEIRKHRDEIWNTMILLLMGAKCDIGYCEENDSAVSFCFHNSSDDSDNRKFICIVCFKN